MGGFMAYPLVLEQLTMDHGHVLLSLSSLDLCVVFRSYVKSPFGDLWGSGSPTIPGIVTGHIVCLNPLVCHQMFQCPYSMVLEYLPTCTPWMIHMQGKKTTIHKHLEVSWNRGTPSHHPNFHGIFPNKNHPAIGVAPILWKPPYVVPVGFAVASPESVIWEHWQIRDQGSWRLQMASKKDAYWHHFYIYIYIICI